MLTPMTFNLMNFHTNLQLNIFCDELSQKMNTIFPILVVAWEIKIEVFLPLIDWKQEEEREVEKCTIPFKVDLLAPLSKSSE